LCHTEGAKQLRFSTLNLPVIQMSTSLRIKIEDYVKRALDLVCGLFFLIIFIPPFFIIAILIKIDSKGPVFFLQKRSGKDGIEFHMYKFRTMIHNAESYKRELKNETDGPMFKMRNDPRITRLGKILRNWSLDELPQLLNIIKGEMSFVGPRPLADKEMAGDEYWKKMRLSVKPGITGLWQVKGRGSSKFCDWIKYDIEYVQKRSLFMDIKILFLTMITVLKTEGAY